MAAERPEEFVLRVTARIAGIRRARGMTQDELAEALGTATRNVQRVEAGQNLTLYTLARIAAVLGVRPDDLLTSDQKNDQRRPAPALPKGGKATRQPSKAAEIPRTGRSKRI